MLLDRPTDPLRQRFGPFTIRTGEEDGEFFPTIPRHHIMIACATLGQTRDLIEDNVTGRVTEAVVERFEMIDIQQEQRQRQAMTDGKRESDQLRIDEETTIPKPR